MERLFKEKNLSPRERELAALVQGGYSNQEISIIAGISINTVKFHLKHIFCKFGICNRTTLMSLVHQSVLEEMKKEMETEGRGGTKKLKEKRSKSITFNAVDKNH